LIQAKQVGDMMNVLLIETEKLKTWDAIKWLESQGFKPNT
jgi:hypothetical protein